MQVRRLNFNADTMEEAKQYLETRLKQLCIAGVVSGVKFQEIGNKALRVVINFMGEDRAMYYILKSFRGQGLLTSFLETECLPILTLPDCGIESYLEKVDPKSGFSMQRIRILETEGYRAIQHYYGDKRAERSGVYLMNHIDEGLAVMNWLGASIEAMEAYCIHPILQNDKDLAHNLHTVVCFNPYVVALAMEYRNKANSYLCRENTDHFTTEDLKSVVGELIPEVRHMLIADKVQNQKDFIKYHYKVHKRSKELNNYFIQWLDYLNVPQCAFDVLWKG